MNRKRDKRITFRMSEDEHKKIKKKIEKSKLSQTDYLIRSALEKEIIVLDDIGELLNQVRRVGVNLNQLTKLAHLGKQVEKKDLAEIEKELGEIWQLLRLLTQAVH